MTLRIMPLLYYGMQQNNIWYNNIQKNDTWLNITQHNCAEQNDQKEKDTYQNE